MSMSIINQRWHSHMNDTDTCTLIVTTICSFLDDWSLFRKVMCLNRKWHSVASRRTKLLEKVPLFVTPLESLRKAYEQFDICNNNRKKFMREYRQYSGEATELVAVETDTEYANVFDNLNQWSIPISLPESHDIDCRTHVGTYLHISKSMLFSIKNIQVVFHGYEVTNFESKMLPWLICTDKRILQVCGVNDRTDIVTLNITAGLASIENPRYYPGDSNKSLLLSTHSIRNGRTHIRMCCLHIESILPMQKQEFIGCHAVFNVGYDKQIKIFPTSFDHRANLKDAVTNTNNVHFPFLEFNNDPFVKKEPHVLSFALPKRCCVVLIRWTVVDGIRPCYFTIGSGSEYDLRCEATDCLLDMTVSKNALFPELPGIPPWISNSDPTAEWYAFRFASEQCVPPMPLVFSCQTTYDFFNELDDRPCIFVHTEQPCQEEQARGYYFIRNVMQAIGVPTQQERERRHKLVYGFCE